MIMWCSECRIILRIWTVGLIVTVWGRDTSEKVNESGFNEDEPLWKTYLKCKPDLGMKSVTCDPDNGLEEYGVKKQIDDLMWRMQTDVPCYCDNEQFCNRYEDLPIQSGLKTTLISFSGGDLPDDVDRIIAQIGKELDNQEPTKEEIDEQEKKASCDNRLLLIYAIDTRALLLYPGSAVNSVFDYLPTRRRRIEPVDLVEYLKQTLSLLQRKAPAGSSMSINHLSHGWSGWEIVVGMIGAIILVTISIAALVSLFLTGCCRKRKRDWEIEEELEAYRRYERECKEWTRRARNLAKHRAKMVYEVAKQTKKSKTETTKNKSTGEGGSSGTTRRSKESAGEQPYYIVTEPSSVYNSNLLSNWSLYEKANENEAGGGTIRSGTSGGNVSMEKKRQRETQRRDFYFQDE